MLDAWSWDRNPPNVTLDLVSYCSANKRTTSARELHYVAAFVCLHFCLTRYKSAQFVRRALHYASGSRKFLRQSAQHPWGRVYCHPQTECFVVSQHFSVARHVGRLKLGSKPAYTWQVAYIYHSLWVFPALGEGFPRESERQHVSSSLQDVSKYSGWS